MSDETRVNGNQLSWGSITIKIDEQKYFGFTAITFGDKRERVYAWGINRSQAPRGRSRGKYTPEPVQLTGWKGSTQQVLQALADAAGGESYGDFEFQIIVEYFEADDTPITVELEACVVVGVTASEEEGADPLKEELEINTMRVRRNGLVLFDNSEDA